MFVRDLLETKEPVYKSVVELDHKNGLKLRLL